MERVGHLQQWGGTRLVTLEDGAERGVRAIEFRSTSGLNSRHSLIAAWTSHGLAIRAVRSRGTPQWASFLRRSPNWMMGWAGSGRSEADYS